ncbi:hypothetical protein FGADI_8535 [Fusarium gaditjirri]|uniref:Uncharacterized protein n=1 Tax=Fusarium gaditjirri TaxID=282569 RepID=A0A8H4T292_9HYPO|nr:hypothetical protein FGADI_8535 [Fusarium gaditjirri]
MDPLPPSCACEAEVTRLKARVTILERQLARFQTEGSSDKVPSKRKKTLTEATTASDAGHPRKKTIKRSETGVLASKASLLTCTAAARNNGPMFDRRYLTVTMPPPARRDFSRAYLLYTQDDMDPRVTEFRLRHRHANECPIRQHCRHWHIVDGSERHQEGDIYILLYCLDIESAREGYSECEGINMYDSEEPLADRITLQPCRIFAALKPDFSPVEDEGYVVLRCLVLDYGKTVEEDADEWKWMDQHGRLISRM